MTKEELAAILNGREIGHEITKAEEAAAKEARLVVIFGASDDLCELRGAINDETGAYGEFTVTFDQEGHLLKELDRDDTEVLKNYGVLSVVQKHYAEAVKVKGRWCDGDGPSWTYETEVPHASFDVIEKSDTYCRGIIIDLSEAEAMKR